MKSKIKNIILSLTLIVTLCFTGSILSACGKRALESLSYVEGSLDSLDVWIDSEPELSKLKATATYEGGKTKTITRGNLDVTGLNTRNAGPVTITISYTEEGVTKSFNLDLEVIEADADPDAFVIGYNTPAKLQTYIDAKSDASEAVEDEGSFMKGNEPYYVGTDSSFYFFPKVTAINPTDSTRAVLKTYTSAYTFKVKNGTNWDSIQEPANPEEPKPVEVINASKGEIKFDASLAGKTVRITAVPSDDSREINEEIADDTVSFEVVITEGYNAYNALDLSVIDNYRAGTNNFGAEGNGTRDVRYLDANGNWMEKAEKVNDPWADLRVIDIEEADKLKAVILHDNIQIKMSDLPAYYKVGNGLGEILKGYYRRSTHKDGEFSIIGNYYTIDASQLPDMYIPKGHQFSPLTGSSGNPPQSRFIVFDGYNKTNRSDETHFKVGEERIYGANHSVKNVRFIGNGPRENENEDNFGSLQLINNGWNSGWSDMIISNCIASQWNTAFCFDWYNTTLIENTRSYDCFSMMVQYWMCGDRQYINNCQFARAGGPLIVLSSEVKGYMYLDKDQQLDFSNDLKNDSTRAYTMMGGNMVELKYSDLVQQNPMAPALICATANVTIDHKSKLTNFITGQETWFQTMGVTGLSGYFQMYVDEPIMEISNTKTVLDPQHDNKVSLIAVTMHPALFGGDEDEEKDETVIFNAGVTILDADGNAAKVLNSGLMDALVQFGSANYGLDLNATTILSAYPVALGKDSNGNDVFATFLHSENDWGLPAGLYDCSNPMAPVAITSGNVSQFVNGNHISLFLGLGILIGLFNQAA